VKPAPFAYHAPHALDEALGLLARHGDEAKILAGGQSLVPLLNFRLARPAVVVDINRVAGLDEIRAEDGRIAVGALVRQRRLEVWARQQFPFLADALRYVGHQAIRTRGTVAGSLAHADPAAELPALLVCLEGSVVARSPAGLREVRARELFVSHLTTSLRPDELITEVRLPRLPQGAGWGFLEVARRHGDFALVGAAAVVSLAGGRIAEPRVALFGCGATPVRATRAETILAGQPPTPEAVGAAARDAAEALAPESDLHATAEYRRRVARTLMARALGLAVGRARGDGP
jgi:aerobic carbon-monoxide dehydrogenase medium subunit